MSELEIRTCQGCRKSSIVYRDGFYELVKYGVRHYSHAVCLAIKIGTDAARAAIPEHQRGSFDVAIASAGDWDGSLIDILDRRIASRAHRLTSSPRTNDPDKEHAMTPPVRNSHSIAIMTEDTPPPSSTRKKRRGPGRPPRAGKVAGERFEMRVTEREIRAWVRAAGKQELSVSAWLRKLANDAAGTDVPPGQ